jgi:D-inositol-3-phosphate glycosyltransferase
VLGRGRFTEYDKMDLFPLLQAFRAVVDAIAEPARKPVLLLAGARQGTKTPEMVRLWAKLLGISDRVLLEIDFAEGEKANLLAAADLFVSPSDNPQETFGLSVVEAMAAGLPVVVSDFDGYKDTVTDEVGIRVPTRALVPVDRLTELGTLLYERPLHLFLGQTVEIDLPALEAAVFALVSDPARRARMAAAGVARVRGEYDWRVVIPRYEALWSSLAEATPQARRTTGARPPLAMDFDEAFASFPSEVGSARRLVMRSALAETLVGKRNQYLIYPELRNLFSDDDVIALLALAKKPITMAALAEADATARPAFAPWRRDHALAWLVKHGLLVDTAA